MTYTEKYGYWKMISDYDIETAKIMLNAERWIYVATVCYSAVERLLKGLIVYLTHKEAPKSDNLVFLLNRISDSNSFGESAEGIRFASEKSEYLDRIIDVTYYHISDYPFSYQKIMDRFIDENTAKAVYTETLEILCWLASFGAKEGN